MEYKDLSREKLLDMKKTLEAEYEAFRAKGLKLDMSRGKPNKAQLDLTNGMLDTVNSSSDMTASDGMETRNYGGLMGIPECRKLMAEIVGADAALQALLLCTIIFHSAWYSAAAEMSPGSSRVRLNSSAPAPAMTDISEFLSISALR